MTLADAERIAARKGHFMPPGLLASQFKTLERPGANERPIIVSIDVPVEAIVEGVDNYKGLAERGQRPKVMADYRREPLPVAQ